MLQSSEIFVASGLLFPPSYILLAARQHCKILGDGHDEIPRVKPIGEITSGCPSTTLGKGINVAIGYVPLAQAKNGTKVQIQVRNKLVDAQVTKMPFVPTNYYFGTK